MVVFNFLLVVIAFAGIHAVFSSIANLITSKLHLHRVLTIAIVALLAPLALKLITGEWGYAYFGFFIFTLPQIAAFVVIYKNSSWSGWFWRPFLSTVLSFFMLFFVGL